jgi:hypothetical protein
MLSVKKKNLRVDLPLASSSIIVAIVVIAVIVVRVLIKISIARRVIV